MDSANLKTVPPLEVGNLKARRDWGFAPDYVDGIIRVIRQVYIRSQHSTSEPDIAASYRDYVLGSGKARAVWELIDCAFKLVGVSLIWDLDSEDPLSWKAYMTKIGTVAVSVNSGYLRPNDPATIEANPTRAQEQLGWIPRNGIEEFMTDMIYRTRDT